MDFIIDFIIKIEIIQLQKQGMMQINAVANSIALTVEPPTRKSSVEKQDD